MLLMCFSGERFGSITTPRSLSAWDSARVTPAKEYANHGQTLFNSACKAKIMSINNLQDEDSDYVPSKFDVDTCTITVKDKPRLTWHVASYKEGNENFLKASIHLQKKVGLLPQGNIKRYGKNILIKATNDVQANMLTRYKPSEEGNIFAVSPHKTFNTPRGIVYSKDLYAFTEEEILNMCPSNVHQVRKLKGIHNAILLTFSSPRLPEEIEIDHLRIKVKKYIPRPVQCRKCFEYGHIFSYCKKDVKCFVCSENHELQGQGTMEKFCFHCENSHSPNWKGCSHYKFEQAAIELANNEFISIGSAKRIILGANKQPGTTHASVVKKMRAREQNNLGQNGSQSFSVNQNTRNQSHHENCQESQKPPSVRSKDQRKVTNLSESIDKSKKKEKSGNIRIETENRVFSITAKSQSNNNIVNPVHSPVPKRIRNSSPISNNGDLEISNPFSTLEEKELADNNVNEDPSHKEKDPDSEHTQDERYSDQSLLKDTRPSHSGSKSEKEKNPSSNLKKDHNSHRLKRLTSNVNTHHKYSSSQQKSKIVT